MSIRHRAARGRSSVPDPAPETAELPFFDSEPAHSGSADDLAVHPDDAVVDPAAPEYGDDGLAAELARAQPRRWWNRATPWLAAAVLLVGGFSAGIQVQKTYGHQPTAGASRSGGPFGGQLAGRLGGGGNGFPGAGSGNAGTGNGGPGNGGPGNGGTGTTGGGNGSAGGTATSGTVKLVDGGTIYVQTESGTLVTVRTTGKTTVQVPGKLADLKPGDRVNVQGQPAGDSEVTASVIAGRR